VLSNDVAAWFDEAGTCTELTLAVFRGTGTGGGLPFTSTGRGCGFSAVETPYILLSNESVELFRKWGSGGWGWVDFDAAVSDRPGAALGVGIRGLRGGMAGPTMDFGRSSGPGLLIPVAEAPSLTGPGDL